jgi:hypothetical protein
MVKTFVLANPVDAPGTLPDADAGVLAIQGKSHAADWILVYASKLKYNFNFH